MSGIFSYSRREGLRVWLQVVKIPNTSNPFRYAGVGPCPLAAIQIQIQIQQGCGYALYFDILFQDIPR